MIELSEHDLDVMVRCIAGEARGEAWDGKVAVAHVILNRHAKPGWWSRERDTIPDDTVAAVCADPHQFSCFNTGDPNLRYVALLPPTHPVYLDCQAAALAALTGREKDPTDGSCHYHHRRGSRPGWSVGRQPVAAIGNHFFFNDIS